MIEEFNGDFIQWLRGFYFVARYLGFSKAAHKIGRTQPTVTHQVKCLEDYLGVSLLDRSRKTEIKLTPEGEVLFDRTVEIFELIKSLSSEVKAEQSHLTGETMIATTYPIALFYLPHFVFTFKKRHPDVRFVIDHLHPNDIIEHVKSGEADFGIISLTNFPEKLHFQKLIKTKFVLIAPKGTVKCIGVENREFDIEELCRVPFIHLARDSSIRKLIDATFLERGLSIVTAIELDSFEIIKKYVSLGMGVSILYDYMIEERDRGVFDIVPLDQYFGEQFYYILTRSSGRTSKLTNAFIQFLESSLDSSDRSKRGIQQ